MSPRSDENRAHPKLPNFTETFRQVLCRCSLGLIHSPGPDVLVFIMPEVDPGFCGWLAQWLFLIFVVFCGLFFQLYIGSILAHVVLFFSGFFLFLLIIIM